MYVWAKRAFGPFAGFFTGWTYWASNLPYFPALLYFAAGNALFVAGNGGALSSSPVLHRLCGRRSRARDAVNIFGLDVGKWLNNAGAISRWTVTLLLVGAGIIGVVEVRTGYADDGPDAASWIAFKDVIFWSVIAFAWTGPEAISFMGGEVQQPAPQHSLRARIGGARHRHHLRARNGGGARRAAVARRQSVVGRDAGDRGRHGACRMDGRYAGRGDPRRAELPRKLRRVARCGRAHSVRRRNRSLSATGFRPHASALGIARRRAPHAVGNRHDLIFLGQGGSTVKGAYEILVSSTVLITMLPFLLLFASAIKLDAEPAPPGAVSIPGGRVTVAVVAGIGFVTTLAAAVLALFPSDDDPNKLLSVLKVLGLTALMVGAGVAIYLAGRRRQSAQPE